MPRLTAKRVLQSLLSITALVYVLCCAVLFAFQRHILYQPQSFSGDLGRSMLLVSNGEKLKVTVVNGQHPKAVLYFGGNAEEVNYSAATLAAAYPERTVYLMHYRGYGGSTGSPSEKALVADAVALWDRVRPDHAHVAVAGRSLGSGVAVQLARLRPVESLVLVTPYDSILNVAHTKFPFVPLTLLLLDKYESARYASGITVPTLILEAQNDELIPHRSTQRLISTFKPDVVRSAILPYVSHNTVSESPQYIPLLRSAP